MTPEEQELNKEVENQITELQQMNEELDRIITESQKNLTEVLTDFDTKQSQAEIDFKALEEDLNKELEKIGAELNG